MPLSVKRLSVAALLLLASPALAATKLELDVNPYKDPEFGYEFKMFRRWSAIPRRPGERSDWLRAWADEDGQRIEVCVWTEEGSRIAPKSDYETPSDPVEGKDPEEAEEASVKEGPGHAGFYELYAAFIPFVWNDEKISEALQDMHKKYREALKLEGEEEAAALASVREGYGGLLQSVLDGLGEKALKLGLKVPYASEREAASRLDPKREGFSAGVIGVLTSLKLERGMSRHILYNLNLSRPVVTSPFATSAGVKGIRYDCYGKRTVCVAYEVPFKGRTLGLLFYVFSDDHKRLAPHIEACAKTLKADPKWVPVAAETATVADADPRAVAKATALKTIANVPGWWHLETPRYILVTNMKEGTAFPKAVAEQLEAVRDLYERLIPTAEPILDVSIVRICKTEMEYLSYGAPGGSAGYWSSWHKELVLYGPETAGRTGEERSLATLRHEAFHQYVHYAMGSVAPHCWLNEGTGDFFAGGKILKTGGKPGLLVGEFDWRNATITEAIVSGSHVPLKDFVQYDQGQYYANAGLCYSEGWALIYYLLKAAPEGSPWRRIVPTYLETLQETGDEEAANKAAWEGVDFMALEADWIAFFKNTSLRLKVAKSDRIAPILDKPATRKKKEEAP